MEDTEHENLDGTASQHINGLLGSGMPPATIKSKEGYLANSTCTGTNPVLVDRVDQGTQTHIRCFSPQLCIDLVDTLSDEQITGELARIHDDIGAFIETRCTKKKRENSLKQHFKHVLMTDGDTLTKRLNHLTLNFSRHVGEANSQMEELKKNIDAAQTLIADLQAPVTVPERGDNTLISSPAPPLSPSGTPCSSLKQGNPCPYELYEGNPFGEFTADILDSVTDYDRDFGNRKTAYYGELPYKYGGSHHKARDIVSNPYLKSIIDKLKQLPDLPVSSNSFLVTKYDSNNANIPPHSDNEPSIDPSSSILTITLGGPRPVVFRRKPPGEYEKVSITPEHGSLYIMSRSSQRYFDHSVPRISREEFKGTRISITCRTLVSAPPPTHPSPNTAASPVTNNANTIQTRPKRVLILSDSKNATFDCSDLLEPTVAFREDLFLLRDLHLHEHSIRKMDVVLISAGVNDLKRNGADPITLHNHVKSFIDKFRDCRVQFLFDSISPLSMNADRFNDMNYAIDRTNELILQLSLRSRNLKLFDNIYFGLSHLARDGLHLNQSGKAMFSRCWIHCILLALGFRRGPLPLRVRYLNIVQRFYNPG